MPTSGSNTAHVRNIADATNSIRHVFIRDLLLTCLIGVYKREQKKPQRIRINLDLAVREGAGPQDDRLSEVVCYEDVATGVRSLVSEGHVNLVETLAERISEMCLKDDKVRAARVRVEKLDVFEDAVSVGVEIERFNMS